MSYKNREEAIAHILKKYLKVEDNLLRSEKLFIAKSVINWIFDVTKELIVIKRFMADLEKHIAGTLHLKWIDSIVTKKESRTHNDSKDSATQTEEDSSNDTGPKRS